MRKSLLFFGLRIGSTVLATVWSFLLAYTLVRLVGLEDYAFLATVLALAALMLQADLGLSVRLFSRMRQNFLDPTIGSRDDLRSATATGLLAYASAAVVATVVFAIVLWVGDFGPRQHRLATVLLFSGAVLPLPWMVLRVAVNALDHYVLTEAIDCGRRAALLVITAALAFGLPLLTYAIGFVLLWLTALLVLFVLAQRWLDLFHGVNPAHGWRVLRADVHGIAASAGISVSEFLTYIFPYYVIPLMHREATAVVAFDMFYKVTRFAVTAYLTVTETMLPHQTRAFHGRNSRTLKRVTALSFALCSIPAVAGAMIIYFMGDWFFGVLLGHPDIVSPHLRLAMCGMLGCMLLQVVSGSVLSGIGLLPPLARRATLTLAAMLVFTVMAALAGWSIDTFVAGYVALYGCEALSYVLLLLRVFRDVDHRTKTPLGQPA